MTRQTTLAATVAAIVLLGTNANASCLTRAGGGTYSMGNWGNNPAHLQASPVLYQSGKSESDWRGSYEFAFSSCNQNGNHNFNYRTNYYKEDISEMRAFYKKEIQNCQNWMTQLYNSKRGRFCE
ncbi:MAG: hypothetical protein F4X97_13275 [Boseongicola sp. SB0662_bin_57]|nr:hypothetical protein [Boseongicola sp. SB0662_bin_57]